MRSTFSPRRILVPVDFSSSSDRAAEVAVDLALKFDATLVVLHAWMPPALAMLDAAVIPSGSEVALHADRLQQELLASTRRIELPAERVERQLLMGDPARTIVEAAGSERCDAIVMGTHGRTGLAHIALGSVAEHVVRAARVPVLVVPR